MKISSGFVTLNNICRQLYLETDTLPYKLNMMSFSSYNVMFNMLCIEKRLSQRQLDAITQLILPDVLPQQNMMTYLRNLDKVFLAHDLQNYTKGCYRVRRREGRKPKLVEA